MYREEIYNKISNDWLIFFKKVYLNFEYIEGYY
jgi:hypothetical protein